MLPLLALSLLLSWVQVKSDTFVVKSSAGEERAKRVLRELEGFHRLLGTTVVFRDVKLPELPIEVLIIGDDQQFEELAPEYNGRKIRVAGYYQRGEDRDFIVLSARVNGQLSTHTVYHELTHYFVSRSLDSWATWLNEGLAEYFASSEGRGDSIIVGEPSPPRMELLRKQPLLRLQELFDVDANSPYYNEISKANVFYAQAWALVHFLMHGPHQKDFRRYLEALSAGDANLFEYIGGGVETLQGELTTYLSGPIWKVTRYRQRISTETAIANAESIPDSEAQMSISEIFLSNGKLNEARRYLELLAGPDQEFPRASYYRGVLARIAGEDSARELFIDALLDPHLGTRAAVQLVRMHELSVPAVRAVLQHAAASGTRMSDVYWALSEIYLDDIRRIEQAVHARQQNASSLPPSLPTTTEPAPGPPPLHPYAEGAEQHFQYQLLSETGTGPGLREIVPPYFPLELLQERVSGEVVLDVQVMDDGEVSGLWLISSDPDVFGTLATAAVRQWKFDPVQAKVRIVVDFKP
jgi:TonB family protein